MNFDLRELYQEAILNHSKHPRNSGRLEEPTGKAHGYNPLCGDEVEVFLQVADGKIEDVKFEACGCAISVASGSLMTESLKGKTVEEARQMFGRFQTMVTEGGDSFEDLGELQIFEGVREHPVRIKCAVLPWHALKEALGE